MSAEFRSVPGEYIDRLLDKFPQVRQLMHEALARAGDFDFEADFLPDLRTGKLQLWCGVAAGKAGLVVITRIEARPKHRVGQILVCAGENRAFWLPYLADVENWFRAQGCVRVEAMARPGWARDLADYRKTHVMLEKALTDGFQQLSIH